MNNKYFFKILIVVLFVSGSFFVWQHFISSENNISDWGIYKNQNLGYEIKYPSNFYFHEEFQFTPYVSFQEKEKWEGSWEWPRFQIEVFQNENVPLLLWIKDSWLEHDSAINTDLFLKNFDQIIEQREEFTINSHRAIKVPHSYDSHVYFVFVYDNKNIAKLTCVFHLEDISEICHEAFNSFYFLK